MSNLVPAVIYFGISMLCIYFGAKGLKTRQLVFKMGTKDTGLENNKILIWMQIIGVFLLAASAFFFALMWLTMSE